MNMCNDVHVSLFYYRCIDKAGQSHHGDVHQVIKEQLLQLLHQASLCVHHCSRRRCVDYIQSLMEHYVSGERVLMTSLPQGTYVCVCVCSGCTIMYSNYCVLDVLFSFLF